MAAHDRFLGVATCACCPTACAVRCFRNLLTMLVTMRLDDLRVIRFGHPFSSSSKILVEIRVVEHESPR